MSPVYALFIIRRLSTKCLKFGVPVIELNFRNLKMFFGLVTSLPRSVGGYLGNYISSILAYVLR